MTGKFKLIAVGFDFGATDTEPLGASVDVKRPPDDEVDSLGGSRGGRGPGVVLEAPADSSADARAARV
uniref:Uncharacterized protein n=1 Tax=Peronospora matthiolae TaxID=2874970 RepID=A0AAV1TU55_9STRA